MHDQENTDGTFVDTEKAVLRVSIMEYEKMKDMGIKMEVVNTPPVKEKEIDDTTHDLYVDVVQRAMYPTLASPQHVPESAPVAKKNGKIGEFLGYTNETPPPAVTHEGWREDELSPEEEKNFYRKAFSTDGSIIKSFSVPASPVHEGWRERFYKEVVPKLHLREESLVDASYSEQAYLANWIAAELSRERQRTIEECAEMILKHHSTELTELAASNNSPATKKNVAIGFEVYKKQLLTLLNNLDNTSV